MVIKRPRLITCFLLFSVVACGSLGHIQFYHFNAPMQKVKMELLEVINKDSFFTAPKKWNNYDLGRDSINDIFIMFQSDPKELYQLGFVGPQSEWHKNKTCTLALVGIYDGRFWQFEKDLDSKTETRIIKRLETNIFAKLRSEYTKN